MTIEVDAFSSVTSDSGSLDEGFYFADSSARSLLAFGDRQLKRSGDGQGGIGDDHGSKVVGKHLNTDGCGESGLPLSQWWKRGPLGLCSCSATDNSSVTVMDKGASVTIMAAR